MVTLALTVEDARALWSAAADRALSAPGMTIADVLDTIGPREDPSIAECISMLTAPAGIAGCALEGFEVREEVPGQVIHLLPVQERGTPLLPAANG
ncbi:hypothetical protein [Sphingomonas sp. dw_22]|uniref:hypothetical protein n=1 Tax=Sphingomonas sp. dw_22 TaxID=2721175 RepID=UPI001BD61222|nr:hypothetical protein [Sphingomonas sp. dw_22]